MSKIIENLRWKPLWTSQIGCLKGCADYLNLDLSTGWIFGATAHAFIINIHDIVCPSGPTAWETRAFYNLLPNLGLEISVVNGWNKNENFRDLQRHVWDETRRILDADLPCYSWEFDVPEYYVIYGYDDRGYYYSGPGCDNGKGPFDWEKLGMSEIGCVEACFLKPSEIPSDEHTITEALKTAVKFNEDPGAWVLEKYHSGREAFDAWIDSLHKATADSWGMAYNSKVWCECRANAVKFLDEARTRVDYNLRTHFDEAAGHYQRVADNLNRVSELFPFPPGDEVKDTSRREKAIAFLEEAREDDSRGLEVLKTIIEEIQAS